jgi:protein SCO1/2
MRYFIITVLLVGAILGSYYLLIDGKKKASIDPFEAAFPILGFKDISPEGDTIEHRIPDFSFINQDSMLITNETFAGKAYISDFFFIHCPSICPRVKAQMLRIYDKFEDNDNLLLLSHSIDTRNDTVPALKAYAEKLKVDSSKWHFVTGDKDMIFSLADEYFVSAMEAPDVAGGFDHSGRIILVDKDRHVRAFAEGTDPEDVTRFLRDLEWFMKEEYSDKNAKVN